VGLTGLDSANGANGANGVSVTSKEQETGKSVFVKSGGSEFVSALRKRML
jgi:hypothetical protein